MFEVGKVYRWGNGNIKAKCLALTSSGLGLGEIVEAQGIYIKGDPCEMKYPKSWNEVKEPKRGTVWVNVYPTGYNTIFLSRELADISAGSSRLACIEVPWVEGQGL